VYAPTPQPGFKMLRASAPGAWAATLQAFDGDAARVLKSDAGVSVFAARLLGRDVVIKRWDLATPWARAKAMFRASRGDRHWRGAARLARAGLRTAPCLALALEQAPVPRVWLVMEHIPGPTALECLADRSLHILDQHALASALGRQIRALDDAGLYNRDHKPSNLILADHHADNLTVIDTVAIRRGRSPQRMLASLVIEPLGCGLSIRRSLAMRTLTAFLGLAGFDPRCRARRDGLWRDVQARIRAHGDPTPRTDPLAQRPGLAAPPS
jgi:tRNA A-37 threonylcarbamoyl transferase component Bud32